MEPVCTAVLVAAEVSEARIELDDCADAGCDCTGVFDALMAELSDCWDDVDVELPDCMDVCAGVCDPVTVLKPDDKVVVREGTPEVPDSDD